MRRLAMVFVVAVGFPAPGAWADPPATDAVAHLNTAVLSATRSGGGGVAALTPVVTAQFNLEVMARFIAGPAWDQFAEADRRGVVAALTAYVATRLDAEFDGDNQQITAAPDVQSRGPDALVHTEVTERGRASDNVDYRLRAYEGQWRVIDVYDNGVSVLASQRSDAAAAVSAGGAPGLVRYLQNATAHLH